MNDEIKEIKLDHFKDLEELKQNVETWIKEDEMYWNRWFELSDLSNLLDYITNLQEKNEFLKLNNPEMNIEHFRIVKENKRKIDNLRKENERLNNIVKETRQMLYKRMLDDYDTYTANVVCDFQNDFEEIIRLNGGDEE